MIFGAHVIIYSKNAEADRAFFRDVLGFKSVDGGHAVSSQHAAKCICV
jgi:catechol 2,3-dioxygenase-like lactoylglutathione lyase family enzyme